MTTSELDQILRDNFPQRGVDLAFGYGSRVVKQKSTVDGSNLIDIILVVDNSLKWHEENLAINNHHYSFVKYLPNPAKRITQIQERFGACIYYNPYVVAGGFALKYGVISTEHLIADLLHWTKLYVAGRLHKPVEIIAGTCQRNDPLKRAITINRENAIRAACLQLPESFDCADLYTKIVGHSYHGDFRMLFGEDKHKINNIVVNQIERFNQLYLPTIKRCPILRDMVHYDETSLTFKQDKSSKMIYENLKLLPRDLRKIICLSHGKKARAIESDIILTSVSRSINCDQIVAKSIAAIVRRSSISQSLKGLISAGLVKSIKYSQRKLTKSLMSRFTVS